MDAAEEIGRNPVSKHEIQPEYGEKTGWRGTGLPNPSRETRFSGANGDREIFIFSIQLTTSRIDNLTRPVDSYSAICDDHTYALHMDETNSI